MQSGPPGLCGGTGNTCPASFQSTRPEEALGGQATPSPQASGPRATGPSRSFCWAFPLCQVPCHEVGVRPRTLGIRAEKWVMLTVCDATS